MTRLDACGVLLVTAALAVLVGCRSMPEGASPVSDGPGRREIIIDLCDDTMLVGVPPQSGLDRRREPRGSESVGTIGDRALPGLFRFDVSSVPRGAKVRLARLRLHVASWDVDPRKLNAEDRSVKASVARLIETWDEAAATWYEASKNRPWQTIGGTIRPNSQIVVPTVIEKRDSRGRIVRVAWDVTSLVRDWLSGRRPNHGLIIWLDRRTSPMVVKTGEAAEAGQRPALVIRYD